MFLGSFFEFPACHSYIGFGLGWLPLGCDSSLVNDTFGSTLPWQGAGVFLRLLPDTKVRHLPSTGWRAIPVVLLTEKMSQLSREPNP